MVYIYAMANSFFQIYIDIYKLTEYPVILLNAIFIIWLRAIFVIVLLIKVTYFKRSQINVGNSFEFQYFFQTIKKLYFVFVCRGPPLASKLLIIAKRDISNPSLIANTYFSSHGLSYCLYHIICISPTTKIINCLPARLSKLSNGWRSSWGMVPNTSRYNEIIIILVIITVISKF